MSTVAASPYAWPWHGAIDTRRSALIICSDDPAAPGDAPAIVRLRNLVGRARAAGIRVVHLPRLGCPLYVDFMTGDLEVVRTGYGGFTGTELDLVLRQAGLEDLIFAGFPAELGADCTMREANDLGYECLLLTDCSSGLSAETFAGAISSVQMSGGIFGAVADAAAVTEALTAGSQ